MWEVGLPPLLWSFPPTNTFTSFPTPGCWAGATTPAFCSQLVYLQFCEGLPSSLFGTQGTPPSLLCVFFVVIAYSVFFSFYPGWGRSVQIWPRVFCGSTACHLAHLVVCVFPSRLGAAVWWRRGSPAGSPFNVKWRCYAQARGAEESKFCLFSVVFPVRCISSLSPGFYFRRHAFCFLPLATILESPQVW
jgi:hypothetical protein